MEYKVSILVPIYKVEKYIERCLRSIFEQSFQELEYVFVNDCTPDNSMGILHRVLSEYPKRKGHVRVIENKENKGIACVRNILLENAKGEYIYFVDSDDWIEKNTVERLYLQAVNTGAEIVGCNHFHSYDDKEYRIENLYSSDKMECVKNLISMNIKPVLWLFLTKRSLYIENNLRFKSEIDMGEDYIMCVNLFYYARKIDYVSLPFYHYSLINDNSYRNNMLKYRIDTKKAIELVQKFCMEKGIYEQIKEHLEKRKFIFKTKYLLENKNNDYKGYLSVFPELNGRWRQESYRKDIQLYFYLVEKKMFMFAHLLNICKKLFRKFK